MINFTIVNRKQLVTYLVKIIIAIAVVIILTRFFINFKNKNVMSKNISFLEDTDLTACMNVTMPKLTSNTRQTTYNNITSRNSNRYSSILGIEMAMMNYVVEKTDDNEDDRSDSDARVGKSSESADIPTNPETTVILEKNKTDKYTNSYGTVQIKNETGYGLTEEMLKPDITLNNKKDIILFQTHTCESYTATEQFNYTMTGNYRTTDLNYTVSRTGDELEKYLKEFGFNVVHDKTLHDYPAYSGAYSRSMETVQNLLNTYEDTEIVFDIHRDALGNNPDYGPSVEIAGERAAQLLFVIGTNDGGLEHPNWNQNLKFAVKIQEKANEMYPGLFKPILLTKSRYNQNLAKGAVIIEVGATGNSLEETLVSMKYLSKVLSEVLK